MSSINPQFIGSAHQAFQTGLTEIEIDPAEINIEDNNAVVKSEAEKAGLNQPVITERVTVDKDALLRLLKLNLEMLEASKNTDPSKVDETIAAIEAIKTLLEDELEGAKSRKTLTLDDVNKAIEALKQTDIGTEPPGQDIIEQIELLGKELAEMGMNSVQESLTRSESEVALLGERVSWPEEDITLPEDGISWPIESDSLPEESVSQPSQSKVSSSRNIAENLAKAISTMSEEYLEVLQSAVETNLSFYGDFTRAMAQMSKYVTTSDDKMSFNHQRFKEEMRGVLSRNPVPDASTTLFPSVKENPVSGSTLDQCKDWVKLMGLDADTNIQQLDDGTYIVCIFTGPVSSLISYFSDYTNISNYNSAEWAALQSGFDIHKDTLQNTMQTLTQQYSTANSRFDNLVKVLSNFINSLFDTDKSFLTV